MASVFNKIGDIKNDVKRNSFDWSHDNNFTTDLGRITPVFTELVPPNSSVRIKPTFGLRFMPMMFPIQTKMKAYLSFYKVPLRTLWKDYMDFISADNTEEYEPPYMMFDSADYADGGSLSVSGLGDYFGVPVHGNGLVPDTDVPGVDYPSSSGFLPSDVSRKFPYVISNERRGLPVAGTFFNITSNSSSVVIDSYDSSNACIRNPYWALASLGTIKVPAPPLGAADRVVRVSFTVQMSVTSASASESSVIRYIEDCFQCCVGLLNKNLAVGGSFSFIERQTFSFEAGNIRKEQAVILGATITNYLFDVSFSISDSLEHQVVFCCFNTSNIVDRTSLELNDALYSFVINNTRATTNASGKFPFAGSGTSVIANPVKLSAYPFRAYEAIYNAYIRNSRNNPFLLNGKKTYNTWITTNDGGADTKTPKSLRYANWQTDAYTSALQSPQQGVAPLVGLTTYESTTVNTLGHEVTTVNTAIVDEDGNAYKVDFESNGEALKGVNYTPLKTEELTNARAVGSLDQLQQLVSPATSGISINDFRNVNAYQRYLELNQFRGFSYKEIIEGRFDVNVRYDALNMPEYLGGITRDIVVNPITQTVETVDTGAYVGSLGSQAGLATCFGNSDGSISVFCDEESIVMGIMYVMPMPVYDSLLPKWMTYRDRLDSFNPEFDHIGYQPIYNKELALWQSASESDSKPNEVFGYQRPWYEYVSKVDRAHGLFLSSLRNFIMFRSFKDTPELGESFTVMQPGSVNNVFSVTEVSDKILGQIHFDCTAQLPISRVVVPRLE